jgi:hypothetical protein
MPEEEVSMLRALRVSLIGSAALVIALAAAAPPAAAQQFGLRVGEYTHAGNAFVGGDVLFRLPYHWYFNPNVEGVFVDHGHLVTVNLDAHYDLPVRRPAYVWLGGGPALVFRGNGAGGGNSTDFGFDLLAGVGWHAAGVIPYLQAKALLSATSDFVVAFGVRF